jgi:hypothetical protein
MFGDLQQPLARHVPFAQNVFEKGHDIFRPLRSTERNQKQRIVILPAAHFLLV